MLDELREAVRKFPFEPFWIELSSGTEIPIPHPDHVWVRERRAVVEDDRGTIHILSPPAHHAHSLETWPNLVVNLFEAQFAHLQAQSSLSS